MDNKDKTSDLKALWHEWQTAEKISSAGTIVSPVVKAAIEQGILTEDNPASDLISFDIFGARISNLKAGFPEPFVNHAIAMKANPIRGCLLLAKELGMGAECASYQEVLHALKLGFEPKKIVYDSPCKLKKELKKAIQDGVYINLDNEAEIEKVNVLLKELKIEPSSPEIENRIGLRINPVVGAGSIGACSTANLESKFGLPLLPETKDRLFELYKNNPWLHGVHLHVGSQGCPLSQLVAGTKNIYDFVEETNQKLGKQQIKVFDMGGGMPTNYVGNEEAFDFKSYRNATVKEMPDLFSGKFNIITEFGRSVFTKSGITVSRVEAVKDWGGVTTASIHVGANQFIREAYIADQMYHRVSVLNKDGSVKDAPLKKQSIAGPMCFGGDFVAKNVNIPQLSVGDFVVLHDTAGYTMCMYSRYNSICASSVYSYRKSEEPNKTCNFHLLKSRETPEEVLSFWGLEKPLAV